MGLDGHCGSFPSERILIYMHIHAGESCWCGLPWAQIASPQQLESLQSYWWDMKALWMLWLMTRTGPGLPSCCSQERSKWWGLNCAKLNTSGTWAPMWGGGLHEGVDVICVQGVEANSSSRTAEITKFWSSGYCSGLSSAVIFPFDTMIQKTQQTKENKIIHF